MCDGFFNRNRIDTFCNPTLVYPRMEFGGDIMIPVKVEALLVGSVPGKSVVVLRPYMEENSNSRVLPIYVGMPEAVSISSALENKQSRRPQTHDLTMNIIDELGGKFERAIIDRVDGMNFYAKIVLNQDGDVFEIDSRPSDAIAIALRAEAPIYVEEPVFTAASVVFDNDRNRIDEKELEEFHDYVETLTPDDFANPDESDS